MSKKIYCPCQSIHEVDRNKLLDEFADIREQCPALKEILVPDSIWSDFKQKSEESPDTVGHMFKILGAFQLGILSKITFPIHRYLMNNKHPKGTIKNSYKKELIENWMKKDTSLLRHQKARGHEGKINELLCASFLEKQGWEIDNLEALGGDFDIEATSNRGVQYAIEVKYIGQEDEEFKVIEKCCITHNAVADSFSIYDGYNYFLLRVYEASRQLFKNRNLLKSTKKLIAIIVFSHQTWPSNSMPINGNWIDLRPIEFAPQASNKWDDFLTKLKKKNENCYCNIENDLEKYIGQLENIWVVQQNSDLNYSLEKCIEIQNRK